MFTLIVSVLVYWLVFFVVCLTVVEVGQDQFYDAVTPYSGLKVAAGSLIFAGLATELHPTYESILTSDIQWTALQAIVWFLVFMFIFQFHPWHALGLSLITLVIIAGVATLGVDSLTKPTPAAARGTIRNNQPMRGTLNPPSAPEKKAATPAVK